MAPCSSYRDSRGGAESGAAPTPRRGRLWPGPRGLDYTSCDAEKMQARPAVAERSASTEQEVAAAATEPEAAENKPEVHRRGASLLLPAQPAASCAPSGGASRGGPGVGNRGARAGAGGWFGRSRGAELFLAIGTACKR